ncbi:MAG TPA: hypothetical protein DCE41_04680, partial [Cytophagales bacterium]|nr:hypothetical protein [Cytophagales bacterium]
MPRNTLWLFVPALVACLLACQPEVPIELSEPSEIQEPQISSEIVLGKRLNNPYSLKNMRQAARNLSGTQPGGGSGEPLKATHLYVRYLPTETAHVQAIRADTALAWFNYPLDYEIVQGGSTYH